MRRVPGKWIATLLLLGTTTAIQAGPLCDAREANVQSQLDAARQQGNAHRVDGLEQALASIQTHCRDQDLLEDAEDELRESMDEVDERQRELEEALEKGDRDKIEKRRDKLQEATAELEAHTRELEALRGKL
ncbi:DUF1090 domain-containing protein [Marinobacter sp. JSM 1782161]|uniref:DUF1090 domain-containing protein n=1 Tax=Marinobacter sp. JSM 1782161 TaxID=2685906 RepID=UPI0014037123|nr:DUF1090 domain-containing protein [Marinobacter sp. JSM 1782161]